LPEKAPKAAAAALTTLLTQPIQLAGHTTYALQVWSRFGGFSGLFLTQITSLIWFTAQTQNSMSVTEAAVWFKNEKQEMKAVRWSARICY